MPPTGGDLLRAMRLRKGWTQQQTAAQVGVVRTAVAHWERGERLPSTEQIQALCDALEAREEELIVLTTGAFMATRAQEPATREEKAADLGRRLEAVRFGQYRTCCCCWRRRTGRWETRPKRTTGCNRRPIGSQPRSLTTCAGRHMPWRIGSSGRRRAPRLRRSTEPRAQSAKRANGPARSSPLCALRSALYRSGSGRWSTDAQAARASR